MTTASGYTTTAGARTSSPEASKRQNERKKPDKVEVPWLFVSMEQILFIKLHDSTFLSPSKKKKKTMFSQQRSEIFSLKRLAECLQCNTPKQTAGSRIIITQPREDSCSVLHLSKIAVIYWRTNKRRACVRAFTRQRCPARCWTAGGNPAVQTGGRGPARRRWSGCHSGLSESPRPSRPADNGTQVAAFSATIDNLHEGYWSECCDTWNMDNHPQ